MPIPELLKPFFRESFHKLGSLLAPQLFQHWKGVGTILGYHRVLPDKEYAKSTGPYRNLSISVSRFREQMKFIKETQGGFSEFGLSLREHTEELMNSGF